MLGIYNLIWTICHTLMWFYRNAVSFHMIFIVTYGEIFSHLGHTGPLTVNKMALSMYWRRWRDIHAFIGRNTIALWVQRFAAGANQSGTKPNLVAKILATNFGVFFISPVSEGSGDVMVLRRSRPPPAARNGVNTITQKPRDGLFSNLVYTLVVIVSWPD